MTLTFTIKGQPQEGDPLILTVTSDTPNVSFRLDSSLVYTSPTTSSAFGPSGQYTMTGTTLDIRYKLFDDGVATSDTPFTFKGTATIITASDGQGAASGPAYGFDLSGLIRDNDGAGYTINVADPATVYVNLMRFTPAGFLPAFFDRSFATSNPAPAARDLIHALPDVLQTTDVAVAAYQFFTGAVPTMAGLSYLLDPSVNPNSLNSAYYAGFNLENRYINFAANLGVYGEGAAAFQSAYGGLSMHDAVVKAYAQIVGAVDDAAVAAVESSTPYFQAVARERIGGADPDLAAKAAMVGYVLEEAVRAHVGVYAQSLDNFLLDLSDGSAVTGVSLVGVYGPGSVVDGRDR